VQSYEPIPQDRIPVAGFRARRWNRFERDLHAWMDSPEGRFATWRALDAIAADEQRRAR
jgi:hypothetical protein